jgi:hypothetical protein
MTTVGIEHVYGLAPNGREPRHTGEHKPGQLAYQISISIPISTTCLAGTQK